MDKNIFSYIIYFKTLNVFWFNKINILNRYYYLYLKI